MLLLNRKLEAKFGEPVWLQKYGGDASSWTSSITSPLFCVSLCDDGVWRVWKDYDMLIASWEDDKTGRLMVKLLHDKGALEDHEAILIAETVGWKSLDGWAKAR